VHRVLLDRPAYLYDRPVSVRKAIIVVPASALFFVFGAPAHVTTLVK
jgi:hypothetical protein